jgi:type II restriction enzyme
MLRFSPIVQPLWQREKQASLEALNVGKQDALAFLASARQRMVKMSREEAVRELLKVSKVESKVRTINAVSISKIMGIME